MTVADLISILQSLPQHARIVLPDPDGKPQPAVYSLGYGEVQHIELGAWESNGLMLVEPWGTRSHMDGPFDGVILGSIYEHD